MYINKSKIILNIKKLDKTYFSKSKNLTGSIIVPGDKSISQRALIIGLISTGKTVIEDILDSEDVYHTLKAIESLGALVNKKKDLIEINGIGVGNLKTPEKPIYMGNSGTGTRLLLGLVAGSNALVTFYGDQSLSNRPMERVISPLEDMGATIICSKDKKLPITIKGARAKGFIMPINFNLLIPSAQVKSAIIFAALSGRGTSSITEYKKTRNYTEAMLKSRGVAIKIKKIKNKSITLIDGTSLVKAKSIKIPGDPSSAAFLAVAAIITKNSSICIENILHDKFRLNIFSVLKKMGAKIKIIKTNEDKCKIIVKSSNLKNIYLSDNKSSALIDEYPILSIAAACARGYSKMEGLGELRFKESNRFDAIIDGLNKSGVEVKSVKDKIIIKGSKKIKGGCIIDANNDHRIAMCFNILSLVSEEPILIKGNKTIMTSYPNFFNSLISLGANSSVYDG
ncbi:MAG: 3-phosphoshikimate 1-carboxyvinyltransferase [Pelagibacterales bacterium]|nr:3-phosphoshikimate 1-carboxyvinyltransferase [Pelagibacterales bacterium]